METGNNGIIGVVENRGNINAMKEYYRTEYKRIVDQEKKADSDFFHNKWKIRLGSFTTRVGLTFSTRGTVRSLSKFGTYVLGFATEKIMQWKNKRDKRKFQKQKDQLTADFINETGDFEQFAVVNPTIIETIDEDIKTNSK